MAYCDLTDVKSWLGITDKHSDAILQACIDASASMIDSWTGRQFTLTSGTSARVYFVEDNCKVLTDDFATTSGLVVKTDNDNDGTYETTWTETTDFIAQPVNRNYAGTSGAPYYILSTVGPRRFPRSARPSVQVTAQWGWTAIPEELRQATMIQASRVFRRQQTPEGIAGGSEFGAIRITNKLDPDVSFMIANYRRGGEAAGLVVA